MKKKIIDLRETVPTDAPELTEADVNGEDVLLELEADTGMALTQSSDDISDMKRVIASSVVLGRGRIPGQWKEITAEEAAEIEERRKNIDEETES